VTGVQTCALPIYRRDGGVEEIILNDSHRDYPFVNADGVCYSPGGEYIIGETSPEDLISEYQEPTAEPQDEWGDWIGYPGNHTQSTDQSVEYHYLRKSGATGVAQGADNVPWSDIAAYRIKKEPVGLSDRVWIDTVSGAVTDSDIGCGDRSAIITLTDGELDIDWVNE